jgi:hypothetical protein
MCFTYIGAVVLLLASRPASRARLAVQAAVLEALASGEPRMRRLGRASSEQRAVQRAHIW